MRDAKETSQGNEPRTRAKETSRRLPPPSRPAHRCPASPPPFPFLLPRPAPLPPRPARPPLSSVASGASRKFMSSRGRLEAVNSCTGPGGSHFHPGGSVRSSRVACSAGSRRAAAGPLAKAESLPLLLVMAGPFALWGAQERGRAALVGSGRGERAAAAGGLARLVCRQTGSVQQREGVRSGRGSAVPLQRAQHATARRSAPPQRATHPPARGTPGCAAVGGPPPLPPPPAPTQSPAPARAPQGRAAGAAAAAGWARARRRWRRRRRRRRRRPRRSQRAPANPPCPPLRRLLRLLRSSPPPLLRPPPALPPLPPVWPLGPHGT